MNNTPSHLRSIATRIIILLVFALGATSTMVSAQNSNLWNINGNATSNGNFIGTTNNEPLVFKTNGSEAMRIKPNGEVKIASFENLGKGVVTFNNNGVLTTKIFPNDTNQVFCGSGNFKSVAALSGWTRTGNVLYNAPGVNVGIGTNNPQYALDVVGSAYFTGTVSAQGVILTNKLLADTMKAGQMFSLNNNMHMSGGGLNQIYTSSGDLRIQSNANVTASHVIISAGTNSNVGIGTFSPQAKLDVSGDVILRGKTKVYRLVSSNGDSIVRLGDSTMYLNYGNGTIYTAGPIQGVGIGHFTSSTGFSSCAIGYRVHATQNSSIAIGSGITNGPQLFNNTSNSLLVAFNSNVASLFVGPASGAGTYGKVGVRTGNPQSEFQVGSSYTAIHMGAANTQALNYSNGYIGFNLARVGEDSWVTQHDYVNNGGAALMGDIFGNMRIVSAPTTQAGVSQTLSDQTILDNTTLLVRRDGRVVIGKQTIVGGPHDNSFTKLTVEGKVVCKELFVTNTDWADSIFDPTYQLMPLDSLRTFVDSNGHLPNVPTQADVNTTGSNLAANDVIFLAKIEELTLYVLQLQQQNLDLQKRIEEIEKKEGDN